MEYSSAKTDNHSNPSTKDMISSDIEHIITALEMNSVGESKIKTEVDECNNNIIKSRSTGDSSNVNLMTSLIPEMEKLHLAKEKKSNDLSNLAGYIKAVIPPTKTAVIQLASGSSLLDVGTMIFVNKTNNPGQAESTKKYQEIGYISDIFGSILEPMYCVKLNNGVTGDFLKIDSGVFYLPDHSSTRYVSVTCDNNNHYTVVQNQIM